MNSTSTRPAAAAARRAAAATRRAFILELITQDAATTRRAFILELITQDGGAYILPHQNRQPDPALRIASIHCRGHIGIGATEAEAQADWLRQAYAAAPEVAA